MDVPALLPETFQHPHSMARSALSTQPALWQTQQRRFLDGKQHLSLGIAVYALPPSNGGLTLLYFSCMQAFAAYQCQFGPPSLTSCEQQGYLFTCS
jgi:hypothetical protein